MEDDEYEDEQYDDDDQPPRQPARRMMPIQPFKAWDDDGAPCEIVGITYTGDDRGRLEFVVIVDIDGETFSSIREIVMREKPEPST